MKQQAGPPKEEMDDEEDGDDAGDGDDAEMVVQCGQGEVPMASWEDQCVLWARKNGYSIQNCTDKHGEEHGQQLAFSDDDAGLLLLWNYSDPLLNSLLTLVQVHSWHDHSKKHLVKALPCSHRLPDQPPEETVDFEEENYRIVRLVPEVIATRARARSWPPPPEAAAAVTPPAPAPAPSPSQPPPTPKAAAAAITTPARAPPSPADVSEKTHIVELPWETPPRRPDAPIAAEVRALVKKVFARLLDSAGGFCGNSESTTSLSETPKPTAIEDVSTP
ncbi:hypothetical protein CYMTET_43271, partial [Cymbomonas tetramitiformis]